MNEHKKKINYYKSFYDVSKKLNQKQFYEFNMAIYDVMFFEKDIESISFSDNIVELLWSSIKHSLISSIEGYCSKQNIDYKGLFNTLSKGVDKGLNNNANVKEKEKEKDKDKVKEKDIIIAPDKSDAVIVSKYLFSTITSFNQTFNADYRKWVDDIDKAIRIDKRTKEELINCINWIYNSKKGEFWIPNILSGKKLREKYNAMNMQAMGDTNLNRDNFISELFRSEK